MTSNVIQNLPEISQTDKSRDAVEYTYADGVDVYDIKKGPALNVYAVTSNGSVFIEGTDYSTNTDSNGNIESIDFSVGGSSPSDGETFVIDQKYETVMSRFIDAHDIEFDSLESDLEDVIASRQLATASGDELDRIGALFGVLGRRAGRDDPEYRIYLRSIVQSFAGRGSVDGLRFAAAAGLGTTIDQISIEEDFQNLEYDIVIESWPAHRPTVILELAELADPSAVTLGELKYQIIEDAGVNDIIEIQESETALEDITLDDTVTEGANTQAVSDDSTVDDATASTTRTTNTATWESSGSSDVEWSFFEWTTS